MIKLIWVKIWFLFSTYHCYSNKSLKFGKQLVWPRSFSSELSNICRSIPPDAFLGKDALKICSKFTGEHACQGVISIKLLGNFIKMTRRHGCSPVNLLHIFRKPFLKNTSWGLLLYLSWRTNKHVITGPTGLSMSDMQSHTYAPTYAIFSYGM